MQLNHLIPEFYVSDFDKSLKFYAGILGFRIEYTREGPRFAFLSYQGSQIMIQQEDDNEEWHNAKPEYPFGRGINFQIDTTEIDKLIISLNKKNYALKRKMNESTYKSNSENLHLKEFLVMDPDGYLLRFSQKIQ